jgi:hypothetical protein
MSADNQQERLIHLGWIVGFVDGEGCFSIGIVQQDDNHEFAVTQGAKSLSVLEALRDYFQVGKIYLNKRYDNHKEHLYRYVVRRREDLTNVIIPFFETHKLQTSKKEDFQKFSEIVRLVEKGKHLEKSGLIQIIQIVQTMNHKKSHERLIRILTHHT